MARKTNGLTPVQREILHAMASGTLMTQDKRDRLCVGQTGLQVKTRHTLMDAGYLMQLDRNNDIRTKGNGYVITDLGRVAIL